MLRLLRSAAARLWARARRRDPAFPAAERKFLAAHPQCVWCGRRSETAHHTYPVHAYPELEMDQSLWVPTCRADHRPLCHAGDWSRWVERAALLKAATLWRVGLRAEPRAVIAANTLGPKRPGG